MRKTGFGVNLGANQIEMFHPCTKRNLLQTKNLGAAPSTPRFLRLGVNILRVQLKNIVKIVTNKRRIGVNNKCKPHRRAFGLTAMMKCSEIS